MEQMYDEKRVFSSLLLPPASKRTFLLKRFRSFSMDFGPHEWKIKFLRQLLSEGKKLFSIFLLTSHSWYQTVRVRRNVLVCRCSIAVAALVALKRFRQGCDPPMSAVGNSRCWLASWLAVCVCVEASIYQSAFDRTSFLNIAQIVVVRCQFRFCLSVDSTMSKSLFIQKTTKEFNYSFPLGFRFFSFQNSSFNETKSNFFSLEGNFEDLFTIRVSLSGH